MVLVNFAYATVRRIRCNLTNHLIHSLAFSLRGRAGRNQSPVT